MLAKQSMLRIHDGRFGSSTRKHLHVKEVALKKQAEVKAFVWRSHCHS
jgi:hypothetical protein